MTRSSSPTPGSPRPRSAVSYAALLRRLRALPRRHRTLLVGVDGKGGSGKSHFCHALARHAADVTVVHIDDFYLPAAARPAEGSGCCPFDWQRLQRQVLDPLLRDEPGRYRRYDWGLDALAEWHDVPVGGIVVVEGIYATRRELAAAYACRVWVDCPRAVRLARGLARDGDEARDMWERVWMPAEDRYARQHRPRAGAHLVVDGAPACRHDPEREFVRVRG